MVLVQRCLVGLLLIASVGSELGAEVGRVVAGAIKQQRAVSRLTAACRDQPDTQFKTCACCITPWSGLAACSVQVVNNSLLGFIGGPDGWHFLALKML
jgi:hypothetical protein